MDRLWKMIPSDQIKFILPHLKWAKIEDRSPASNVAALMLYIALCFKMESKPLSADADDETDTEGTQYLLIAKASYGELTEMTYLSRKLVSEGLRVLIEFGLIAKRGNMQSREYEIVGQFTKWFKLPCKPIVTRGAIEPFKHFTLRTKHDLNALKLYLYLASVRVNLLNYSSAKYETICERTGIQERDIRRAIVLLTVSGLVVNVEKSGDRSAENFQGPNRYFFKGHEYLVK